jgi:hypothetical protein
MQAGRLTVLKHLECIANSDANRLFAGQLAATMLARFKEAAISLSVLVFAAGSPWNKQLIS